MIPSEKRIVKQDERAQLKAQGKQKHTRFFVLYLASSPVRRYGINVTSAVSKKATERNRVRRAAAAALLRAEPGTPPRSIYVQATKNARGVAGRALQEDILETLRIA